LRTLTGSPVNGGTCARPSARSTQPFTALSLKDWISETLATLPDGANVICARPLCGPASHVVAAAAARPTALAIAALSGPAVGVGGGAGAGHALLKRLVFLVALALGLGLARALRGTLAVRRLGARRRWSLRRARSE
jgi:hypothetical protein